MKKNTFPEYKSCGKNYYVNPYFHTTPNLTIRDLFCQPCSSPCFWKRNRWVPPNNILKLKSIKNNIIFLGDSTVRDLYWSFISTVREKPFKSMRCMSFSSEKKFCKFSNTVGKFNIDFIFLDGSNVLNELNFIRANSYDKYDTFLGCPVYAYFKKNVYNYSKPVSVRHSVHSFHESKYIRNCGLYYEENYKKGHVTILGQTPLPGWASINNSQINYVIHKSLRNRFNLCNNITYNSVSVIDRYGIVMNKTRDCIHPSLEANVAISKLILSSI